jgi:hypothetical protein
VSLPIAVENGNYAHNGQTSWGRGVLVEDCPGPRCPGQAGAAEAATDCRLLLHVLSVNERILLAGASGQYARSSPGGENESPTRTFTQC